MENEIRAYHYESPELGITSDGYTVETDKAVVNLVTMENGEPSAPRIWTDYLKDAELNKGVLGQTSKAAERSVGEALEILSQSPAVSQETQKWCKDVLKQANELIEKFKAVDFDKPVEVSIGDGETISIRAFAYNYGEPAHDISEIEGYSTDNDVITGGGSDIYKYAADIINYDALQRENEKDKDDLQKFYDTKIRPFEDMPLSALTEEQREDRDMFSDWHKDLYFHRPHDEQSNECFKKHEEIEERHEDDYRLLGRLQEDCKYFLGGGNAHEKYLWGQTVEGHIEAMQKTYDKLPEGYKPAWLSQEQIDDYGKQMTDALQKRELELTIRYTFPENLDYNYNKELTESAIGLQALRDTLDKTPPIEGGKDYIDLLTAGYHTVDRLLSEKAAELRESAEAVAKSFTEAKEFFKGERSADEQARYERYSSAENVYQDMKSVDGLRELKTATKNLADSYTVALYDNYGRPDNDLSKEEFQKAENTLHSINEQHSLIFKELKSAEYTIPETVLATSYRKTLDSIAGGSWYQRGDIDQKLETPEGVKELISTLKSEMSNHDSFGYPEYEDGDDMKNANEMLRLLEHISEEKEVEMNNRIFAEFIVDAGFHLEKTENGDYTLHNDLTGKGMPVLDETGGEHDGEVLVFKNIEADKIAIELDSFFTDGIMADLDEQLVEYFPALADEGQPQNAEDWAKFAKDHADSEFVTDNARLWELNICELFADGFKGVELDKVYEQQESNREVSKAAENLSKGVTYTVLGTDKGFQPAIEGGGMFSEVFPTQEEAVKWLADNFNGSLEPNDDAVPIKIQHSDINIAEMILEVDPNFDGFEGYSGKEGYSLSTVVGFYDNALQEILDRTTLLQETGRESLEAIIEDDNAFLEVYVYGFADGNVAACVMIDEDNVACDIPLTGKEKEGLYNALSESLREPLKDAVKAEIKQLNEELYVSISSPEIRFAEDNGTSYVNFVVHPTDEGLNALMTDNNVFKDINEKNFEDFLDKLYDTQNTASYTLNANVYRDGTANLDLCIEDKSGGHLYEVKLDKTTQEFFQILAEENLEVPVKEHLEEHDAAFNKNVEETYEQAMYEEARSEIDHCTTTKSEVVEGLTYEMWGDGSGCAKYNDETIGHIDLTTKEIKIGNDSWTPMPYDGTEALKETFRTACEEKAVEMGAKLVEAEKTSPEPEKKPKKTVDSFDGR